MEQKHFRNTMIFYAGLLLAFLTCFGAIYQNLYVEKNFKQFTVEDTEPVPMDLYLHSAASNDGDL